MDGICMRSLSGGEGRIALRGVRLHATLVGLAQRTRIEQTFVNLEPRAIEAVYTFPLPDGAAVCGFEVVTGDRVLTGTVDENDAAVEKYEDAIAGGHAAFMAEQDRPDVFTVRVGNLKPKQAATVRLTVVRPLDVVDGNVRIAFPTTLAPRYTTDSGTDAVDAAIDGDALNPPHVLDVPYGLTLTADVRLGRRVGRITSPSHPVVVTGDDAAGYRVALAHAAMDGQVVLSIDLAADVGTHVQVERGPDDAAYLAVTFAPEFADVGATPAPAEVVFVLDCSGSMQGESIQQATAALELCLRTLNVGDTFNVCRFGSAFELMSAEPLPYTDATLDQAVAYVRASTGDMGGTELLAPMEAVLRVRPAAGRVRTVVLLTDGQVSNEPAVIAAARRYRSHNRVFPFGIGPAVSTFSVNGLARATGGAAEFVAAGERIEPKVLRTFARVSSPVASDVTVDWGDADVQTLAELPPVFDGDVLAVYGRCAGRLPERVTLRCRTAAGEQAWPAVVKATAERGDTVCTMWARRAIQSLEEVNGVGRSSHLAAGSREAGEVVRLSKAFNLLSSLTSFVAVEHRTPAERNEGRPAVRRVPVAVPADAGTGLHAAAAPPGGWAMGGSGRAKMAPLPSPAAAPVRRKMLDRTIDKSIDPSLSPPSPKRRRSTPGVLGRLLGKGAGPTSGESRSPRAEAGAFRNPPPPPAPAPAPASMAADVGSGLLDLTREADHVAMGSSVDEVSRLLRTQSAAGAFGWDGDDERAAAARVDGWGERANRIEAEVSAAVAGAADAALAASTAKALVLLDRGFPADRAVWTRAADKAVRFLVGLMRRSPDEVVAWLASV